MNRRCHEPWTPTVNRPQPDPTKPEHPRGFRLSNTPSRARSYGVVMAQTVYPSLAYEDASAALEWLQKAFGLETRLVVPGDNGTVIHSEVQTPSGGLIMVLSTANSTRRKRSPRSLGGTAESVYVAVDTDELDELHARAGAAGAEIFNPLRDTEYGREFCCTDPEGHIWTFGTYQPQEPAPHGG